jgi:hypothetical protein
MKLRIRPLTPNLWPALEDLFSDNWHCGGCWCMYWRIGSAYRKQWRKSNQAAFREVVKKGPPPGLLAFDGDMAVGWCQLTPRDALPWLDRSWRLSRVDDTPVWSISCFYVRKDYRKEGSYVRTDRGDVKSRREGRSSGSRKLIRSMRS